MIDRLPTPYDDKIFCPDWLAWRDPEIPEYLCPLTLLVHRHVAAGRGDHTAIASDEGPISYAELDTRVAQYADALALAGCVPGERLLLFATDSVDYVCTWLAAIRLGVVPAVVSDLYKTGDLGYFLADTAAATLFIDAEQIGKLDDLGDTLPAMLQRVVVRDTGAGASEPPQGQLPRYTLSALIAQKPPQSAEWQWHSDDICYMFYSGGTTGQAKGITHLAHDFVLVPARQGAFWAYTEDDIVYASSRKYFTHGIWPGLLIPLSHGATVILDRRSPSPEVVLELLEKRGATKFITVPTILKSMIVHGRTLDVLPDLSKIGLVISASEKISPEVFEAFEKMFGLEILDSIGSSEITYEWIANRPGDSKRGSLGKPVFGYELRLIGKDGTDVTEPGIAGEAWVKSRTSCMFYWRKFDKSRETFIGPWTRTGDNLSFDEDGFIWFAGRDNDVFKVKGLWVSPIEIEVAIASHDAVLEVAVVGVEGSDGLTQARAYVVLESEPVDRAALIEGLKAMVKPLGGYKVPADIRFAEALPRTTLMKIDRRALREAPDAWG